MQILLTRPADGSQISFVRHADFCDFWTDSIDRQTGTICAAVDTMNAAAEEMKRRTKKFSLDILAFVRTLPATQECRDIGGQLRRAGTGVGSNYRATCRSRSRAEFVSRINVALEEADESAFWLEIITEGGLSLSRRAYQLLDEANQLAAILTASSITATEALRRTK
jgi:four helix bundle protein